MRCALKPTLVGSGCFVLLLLVWLVPPGGQHPSRAPEALAQAGPALPAAPPPPQLTTPRRLTLRLLQAAREDVQLRLRHRSL